MKISVFASSFALSMASIVAARSPAPPLDADARKDVVEQLADVLTNDYAYADAGKKMSDVLRLKLAAKAYDSVTAEALAAALNADMHSIVSDKHLNVSFGPRPGPGPVRGPRAPAAAANGAIRRAEILPGNIGYLEVNGVPDLDEARGAIEAAFAFIANTDALIIDLRGNSGGAPETCAFYMSYLSEGAPYVVSTFRNRHDAPEETRTTDLGTKAYGAKKPVFALISARTFSGGEELAYDIQAFKRGQVVGETSGGGANPGEFRSLKAGFTVFVPTGYAVNPVTGKNWEGVGVKPDVSVAPGVALLEAHRLAVSALAAKAEDPMAKDALQMLAQSLAAEKAQAIGLVPNYKAADALVGTYTAPAGRIGPRLTVTKDTGFLVLQLPNRPSNRLIPVSPMQYHLDGLPEDFTATFVDTAGDLAVWLHMGNWPPLPPLVKEISRPK